MDIAVSDIERMIITHGHGDHAGDIGAVMAAGIPVWLHEGDVAMVDAGENETGEVIGVEAFLISLLPGDFPSASPSVTFNEGFVDEDMDLKVLHVGGHTAGSAVVVVAEEVAFVGDLIRGGNLGGAIMPRVPYIHYFHQDQARAHQALREILDDHPRLHTLWPAHGGPFTPRPSGDVLE